MNQAKKLIIYIVINIIVTVITGLTVLYFWENTGLKTAIMQGGSTGAPAEAGEASEGESSQSADQKIAIGEVGGVGNLATEYVKLIWAGAETDDTVSLQGWRLRDENGLDIDILEQSGSGSLELHSQGAVHIYTKLGESNAIELYLDLDDPIWEPGETVSLIDPDGVVHDTYLIP